MALEPFFLICTPGDRWNPADDLLERTYEVQRANTDHPEAMVVIEVFHFRLTDREAAQSWSLRYIPGAAVVDVYHQEVDNGGRCQSCGTEVMRGDSLLDRTDLLQYGLRHPAR